MPSTDQLASLLAREVDCLERLHATLKQEHLALTHANVEIDSHVDTAVENLEKNTQTKNATMAEQADLAAQRGQFLLAHNYENSNAGLLKCIAESNDAPALENSLQALGALAAECQQQNRENGRLIMQKQQQTQGALNILRQNDGGGATYSGKGIAATRDDSRTLGKA